MKALALLLTVVVALSANAAEWRYSAFDAAEYQPSAEIIKGVEAGRSQWTDGKGETASELYHDRACVFSFPAEADIRGITLCSRWKDRGRVNFAIKNVLVKRAGDADFVRLDEVKPMTYTETKTTGAKAELEASKGFLAKNVRELMLEFSKIQNGFIGLAEVEFRGTMKPVPVEKSKEKVEVKQRKSKIKVAPEVVKSEVVRPRIKLAKGEWCYDPDAKVLTDGVWTFIAEAQGDRLLVGKVKGWPNVVTPLDFSSTVKNVFGDRMKIVKLDTRFGWTGPAIQWRKEGGPAAGFVGALKLPGEGLEELGEMAFCGCTNATGDIALPVTLKKLGCATFGTAPKLRFAAEPLPQNVKTIPSLLFENDDLFDEVRFPYVEVVGAGAFRGTDMKSVSFGPSLRQVEGGYGSGAFASCRELESVNFDPASKVNLLSDWFVADCPKLSSLDLTVVTNMTEGAPFQRCGALRSLWLGKRMNGIPKSLFRDVHNICEVHFYGAPNGIPKPSLPMIRRDQFGKPLPRNIMTTFVHLDPASPTYAADLAAWGKCAAGGELKTRGSTWSEEYAGKDCKDRPLLLWTKPISVTIAATVDADEGKGTYGYFEISRGDDDPLECTVPVRYTVSGTAKPGQTYCSLWGDVDIPSGQKSVKVKIRPLNDPKTTTDATVTLALAKGSYALGAKSSATLKVINGATYGGHLYADAGRWNALGHMGNNGLPGFRGNTLKAADWTVNHGFAFENDIQFSKEGVLYLDHDPKNKVYPADWPDTFDNTLKIIPKGAVYKVDAKCGIKGLPAMIAAVKKDKTTDRALLAFNAWDKPFADMVLKELPKAEFWLPVMIYGKETYDVEKEADRVIASCRNFGAKGISIWWVPEVCTDEFFAKITKAGITIDVWTIDDPRQFKEAVNRGARFVTTNRLVPIIKALPWSAEPVCTR